MTKDYTNILEAKRSLKSHLKFMQNLLDLLNGHDRHSRGGALLAAWCIDRYLSEKFMLEIQEELKKSNLSESTEGNIDDQVL